MILVYRQRIPNPRRGVGAIEVQKWDDNFLLNLGGKVHECLYYVKIAPELEKCPLDELAAAYPCPPGLLT